MRGRSAWLIGLCALGCGDPDPAEPAPDGDGDPERCYVGGVRERAPRDVEVGPFTEGAFEPYQDGETVELVWGFQGGVMVTPMVQVEAADGDGERMCLEVALTNELLDTSVSDLSEGLSLHSFLYRDGPHLYSARLDDLIAYDPAELEGHRLRLTVAVDGDVAGEAETEIILAAPEGDPPL